MTGRRPTPWWAELLLTLGALYLSWQSANPDQNPAPVLWFHLHRASIGVRRAGIALEQTAYRKYLESVMH